MINKMGSDGVGCLPPNRPDEGQDRKVSDHGLVLLWDLIALVCFTSAGLIKSYCVGIQRWQSMASAQYETVLICHSDQISSNARRALESTWEMTSYISGEDVRQRMRNARRVALSPCNFSMSAARTAFSYSDSVVGCVHARRVRLYAAKIWVTVRGPLALL